MDDTKHVLTSLTFWSAAFGTLLQVLKIAGIDVPLDNADILAGHAVNVASAVAFGVAFYGRVRATKGLRV